MSPVVKVRAGTLRSQNIQGFSPHGDQVLACEAVRQPVSTNA